MKGRTHAVVGIATSVAICHYSGLELTPVTASIPITIGAIAGLLPDIDHSGSMFGSKFPIFGKVFKHRGFTHTLYFLILATFTVSLLNIGTIYTLAFCGALFSHSLGDMLTSSGVYFLKLGNIGEIKFCIPLVALFPPLEMVIGAVAISLSGAILTGGWIG